MDGAPWQLRLFSTWSAAATLGAAVSGGAPPSRLLRTLVAVAGTAWMTALSPAPASWHVAALALHLAPLAHGGEGSGLTDAALALAYLAAVHDVPEVYREALEAAGRA